MKFKNARELQIAINYIDRCKMQKWHKDLQDLGIRTKRTESKITKIGNRNSRNRNSRSEDFG